VDEKEEARKDEEKDLLRNGVEYKAFLQTCLIHSCDGTLSSGIFCASTDLSGDSNR
jgi:hypothetical protein